MGVFGFDGNDDGVAIALGGMVPTGAHTFAILVYRGVSNAWHNLLAIQNGDQTPLGIYSVEISDSSHSNNPGLWGRDSLYGWAGGAVASSAWSIIAATKAAGVSLPRMHRRQLGGSWTHANTANGSFGIDTGAAAGNFGLYTGNIDDLNGRIAVACWWDSVLTDQQIEALSFTSFAAWRYHSVAPHNCWKFRWEDGNLADVIGTADETSRTGTATAAEPTNWSWGDIGLDNYLGAAQGGGTSLGTIALTTTAPVAAGAKIVVGVAHYGGTVTGITDSAGNSYYSQHAQANGNNCSDIWTAYAPSGLASGSTITVTYSTSVAGREIMAASFLGCDPGIISFAHNGQNQSGVGAWSSNTVTPPAGEVLLIGISKAGSGGDGTNTPDTGWNELADLGCGTGDAACLQFRVVQADGSTAYAATGTWTGTQVAASGIVAIRRAGDAPAIIGTTEIDSSSATGSQSITVPANCDAVVLFVAGYGPLTFTPNYFSVFDGLSLGTSNFTVAEGGADDEQYHCSAAFVIFDPPTGSQTFDWDWKAGSSPQDGVHMTFVFLAGTGNSIRSHAGDQWATNTTTVNVGALNVEPGDIVLAWGENYAGTASSFTWAGGVTKYADYHTGGAGYNTTAASLATANPSSSGTITPTLAWTANASDGSMIVLAIPAPSGAQEYTDQSTVSLKLTPSGTDEYTQANPPQKIYPTSDVSVGSWTPTPSSPATLYDKINEVTLDTSNYITSDVVGGGGGGQTFPLKISSSGRYLTYQDDTPFLIKGDSTQALPVCLSLTQMENYLDDRVANGFNAVWLNILTGVSVYGYNGGLTYDGIAPFTSGSGPSTYDCETPNSTYWARMDSLMDLLEERNMLVLVNPAEWIDWNGFYWNNGETKIQAYGYWLATRWAARTNIIWWLGNDFQTWNAADHVDANLVGALAAGLRNGSDFPISILLNYDTPSWSSMFDHWHSPVTKPDLNGVYTYFNVGWSCYEGRADIDADPMPTFLAETNYEYENNTNSDAYDNLRQRIQEWSAFASGMCGHMYGNAYTAHYIRDWGTYPDECHTESLTQWMMANDFMEARAWYDLAPDLTNTVLTAGFGTYDDGTDGDYVSGGDFAPCAITPDDTFAIIYSPNGASRTLTVDMTEFSGTVTARWLDPGDGTLTADAASPLANTGSHNFVTPSGVNSDGSNDWVLVLEVLGA